MTQRDLWVDVAIGDDLPLLGQLESTIDRTGRLGDHGPRHRTAATADRAAPAMEQGQLDVVPLCDCDQRLLGAVEHPRRCERSRLFGRVRVTQHHLLACPRVARWR